MPPSPAPAPMAVAGVRSWPYNPTSLAGVSANFLVVYQDEDDGRWYKAEEWVEPAGAWRNVVRDTAMEAYHYVDHCLSQDAIGTVVDRTTGLEVPRQPLPPPEQRGKKMIDLNLKREGGRLYLYVNAKSLHETLDRIGVPFSGEMYSDRPRAATAVCDRTTHTLSTETLLRRAYPAKYDVSAIYTEPTNPTNLKRLLDSAYEQTRKILEHYQPIDIKVSIQKKVLKPADQG